jgi:cytochrome P460
MNCAYSKEILALYIEDDLPSREAVNKVESHISDCAACRQYCHELRNCQSWIKSRFQSTNAESVTQYMLTRMRCSVLSQLDAVQRSLGWALRLERYFMLGLRTRYYAVAGVAILAIVSASMLGQIQQTRPKTGRSPAVFVGQNTLVQPAGYREWVFVGSSLGLGYTENTSSPMYHNVYINPDAYREYVRSGAFPEGTVMVLEMLSAQAKQEPGLQGSYQKEFTALEVSVKDSNRFDGGWGFYDFTEGTGKLKPEAEALPQTAGCLSCHREKAATDHVFTQFYPVLRGTGPGTI